jgi:hypothetical protein
MPSSISFGFSVGAKRFARKFEAAEMHDPRDNMRKRLKDVARGAFSGVILGAIALAPVPAWGQSPGQVFADVPTGTPLYPATSTLYQLVVAYPCLAPAQFSVVDMKTASVSCPAADYL